MKIRIREDVLAKEVLKSYCLKRKLAPNPCRICYNKIMDLDAPVKKVKGVGPKTAQVFEKANICTIGDLLYYLPRTYENYQPATNIDELRPGKVVVRGKISDLRVVRTKKRGLTITEGVIRDETGAIRTMWFNQPYRAKQFNDDREYYFTGMYELKGGRYQLTTPSATLVQDMEEKMKENKGFQPIYSTKSSVRSLNIQKMLATLRPDFAEIPDLLPITAEAPDFVKPGKRADALFDVHFPENPDDVARGREYLAYEELFELILAAKLNQQENQKLRSRPLPFSARHTKALVDNLPFKLTGAQRKATWEILQDLGKDMPMNRLLQGDVGSGKTIVAAIAAAQAAQNGAQTALLAPTAILATQHFESLVKLFDDLKRRLQAAYRQKQKEQGDTKVEGQNLATSPEMASNDKRGFHIPRMALITGATKNKNAIKRALKNGEIDFVIGTHALITDDTVFKNLGFCIIDEQHRFGVGQRQKLMLKSPEGTAPHLLSMTATPIPRSLQLTIFGDLDCSLINELPAGRQPITTKILQEVNLSDDLYPQMREMIKKGQQIYWICRLIEDTPTAIATSVKKQAKKLQDIFKDAQVGVLHGKMPTDEKDQVMNDFAAGKIEILVSTTVVEVGVNVPNANLIVIQDADGYGLAQLHQLRGRVGRGDQAAFCYLLLPGEDKPTKRLKELEKSTDGFYLAEVDLKIRGPGEIYGALQHGALNLQIANLNDTELIAEASHHAGEFARNPQNLEQYPELARRIQKYQQLTTLN